MGFGKKHYPVIFLKMRFALTALIKACKPVSTIQNSSDSGKSLYAELKNFNESVLRSVLGIVLDFICPSGQPNSKTNLLKI